MSFLQPKFKFVKLNISSDAAEVTLAELRTQWDRLESYEAWVEFTVDLSDFRQAQIDMEVAFKKISSQFSDSRML